MLFAAYWLLRNEVDSKRVDTVAVLAAAEQTTFSETTARPTRTTITTSRW